MSYEGFTEYLCKNGHHWGVDVYGAAQKTCTVCNEPFVWQHQVDCTNGECELEDGTLDPDTTSWPLEVDHYVERVIRVPIYKIPTGPAPRKRADAPENLDTQEAADSSEDPVTSPAAEVSASRKPIVKQIENIVTDMVSNMLYYDRKGDEDVPVQAIEKAIAAGDISAAEIVEIFRREFIKGVGP